MLIVYFLGVVEIFSKLMIFGVTFHDAHETRELDHFIRAIVFTLLSEWYPFPTETIPYGFDGHYFGASFSVRSSNESVCRRTTRTLKHKQKRLRSGILSSD